MGLHRHLRIHRPQRPLAEDHLRCLEVGARVAGRALRLQRSGHEPRSRPAPRPGSGTRAPRPGPRRHGEDRLSRRRRLRGASPLRRGAQLRGDHQTRRTGEGLLRLARHGPREEAELHREEALCRPRRAPGRPHAVPRLRRSRHQGLAPAGRLFSRSRPRVERRQRAAPAGPVSRLPARDPVRRASGPVPRKADPRDVRAHRGRGGPPRRLRQQVGHLRRPLAELRQRPSSWSACPATCWWELR